MPRLKAASGFGSSPLARGLHYHGTFHVPGRRIIPARAGFTSDPPSSRNQGTDHPRSRGVYESAVVFASADAGSSPLARGLQVVADLPQKVGGIIPARAGFTGGDRVRSGSSGDHPRSRGVYDMCSDKQLVSEASSPLARGLRSFGQWIGTENGIIPARAGFTHSCRSRGSCP